MTNKARKGSMLSLLGSIGGVEAQASYDIVCETRISVLYK